MKTLAIISEFNPFHNGHKYLLDQAKKKTGADLALTIMSGDWVQRGEPAIIDKFRRADTAISAGFDLVIEMPVFVSLQSASFFARKNIEILDQIGIDYLAFGVENIKDEDFTFLASSIFSKLDILERQRKNYLDQGLSYTQSSYMALEKILGENFPLSSNNILALEYLKAIKDIGSDMSFIPIERKASLNKDKKLKDKKFASSTAIRNNLENDMVKDFLPKKSYKAINDFYKSNNKFPSNEDFFDILKYKVLIERSPMEEIVGFEKGMDRLFDKSLRKAKNYMEFIGLATSSRYTSSRIRRLSLNYILENTFSYNDIAINFIKILASTKSGMAFIGKNKIKKIISKKDRKNLSKDEKIILDSMVKSSNLYNMTLKRPIDYDFTRKFKIK